MIRRILKYAGIITGMSLIGLVLLTLVFSFDSPQIDAHIAESLPYVPTDRWAGYGVFGSFRGAWRDTPTENIMLRTAALEHGRTTFMNALSMHGYERYWHGYVLLLRPLLMFTELHGIYTVNRIVFYVLMAVMLVMLGKKTKVRYPVFLCAAFIPAFFFVIPDCMQFLSVFLIAFAVGIFVLAEERKPETLCVTFIVTGALTSFFDFLTAPLVTLTIPLSLILLVRMHGQYSLRTQDQLKEIIALSVLWAAGYFGMWFMKWVLASVFLQRNMILDGLENTLVRIGAAKRNITRGQAVRMNLETYAGSLPQLVIPLCVLNAVTAVVVCVKKPEWTGFVLVQLMPVVWCMVLSNHTAIHCFMTYRMLVPSAFIMILMMNELSGLIPAGRRRDA